MELPDVGRLQSIPGERLPELAQRLRAAGLAAPFLARLARVGERLDDALRAPMRLWNARRMREPAAAAARLFILHDAVRRDEAEAALGALAPLVDGGLLEEAQGGLVSRFHLALAGDLFCFGDRVGLGGDAVMPLCGATLELVRAAMPERPVERALDLGCGAGAVGMLLARAAGTVVATDVNPRALAFTRLNLALNGVPGVEVRQGDLYESVRGERFDRIASHPPFLARRAGEPGSTFTHGGTRGDELTLRMLAGAAGHLAPGGRAVMVGDWPVVDGDPLDARVRAALGGSEGEGQGADVLVLQSPSKNLDEYCTMHAAVEHRELGEAFAQAALAHREHLEALGLRGIALACVMVRRPRGEGRRGWTSLVPVRHVHDAPITGETIDRLLAARALAGAGPEAVATTRLRVPPGARLVEQPMPDGAPPATVLHLPAGRPEWPIVLEAPLAAWVAIIGRSPTVREAARSGGGDEAQAVDAAREALTRGALEPA
ncbi:MAG TPA: methyltransferase [Polyangiaceae bacterium]